jgi:hypothetical protein
LPAAAGAVRASAPRDALERAATRAARRGDERAHRAVRARMASNKRARATPATTPATTLADANLIAQLVDVDGVAAGPELDLPPDVGARELQSLLRELLRASSANPEDDDRLTTPYAFYVDGEEVTGALAATIVERKISVEQVLKIVYQPQSVFRVRAVTRCSAAIAGHAGGGAERGVFERRETLGERERRFDDTNVEFGFTGAETHAQGTHELGAVHRVERG